MCGEGVLSIVLLPPVARCIEAIYVCLCRSFLCMSVVVTVWGVWECFFCSGCC